jgi:hypothetical protein
MPKKARETGDQRSSHRRTHKVVRARLTRAKRHSGAAKSRTARPRGPVRVVRSRTTRARKPAARKVFRPLPPAEVMSERVFLSSLERSLRDNRIVWETLAKR